MKIISIKDNPSFKVKATQYIISKWATQQSTMVYQDCIDSMMTSPSPIPQWSVMVVDDQIVGCIGLVTNDFISRMDLWPWIVAVYVESDFRNQKVATKLINWAVEQAALAGFEHVYLATDLETFYEKLGFEYIATGYHPWGDQSRIYQKSVKSI